MDLVTNEVGRLLSFPSRLLAPLASGKRFLLGANAGLFVVLAATEFLEDTRTLDGTTETT